MTPDSRVSAVLKELADMADPKTRAVNERQGDDHGIKLGPLRALAKRLGKDQALACRLWAAEDSAARLAATLICRPKDFERDELDTMLRSCRTPKVQHWLVTYVVAHSHHADGLRTAWLTDTDPIVASAGWMLTASRVPKNVEGLNLDELLDVIEAEMATAPDRLQAAMNTTLAQIGIEHPGHRQRAITIGEQLGVYADYPTPPNCTSPYAPTWIDEMVRRRNT